LGARSEDAQFLAREGAHMRRERSDRSRRFAEVPKTSAMRRFVDAVVALSDDPRPDNIERYLVASRALEDFRREPPHTASAA
jgi:hypothetical protein